MELYQAHHQWMNRPADERFTSLLDLNAFCVSVRENSRGKTISSRALEVRPVDGDHKALMVVGPNGAPVTPTHWSFGQLAGLSNIVPAGALRKLPAAIAADCLNYGLQVVRDIEDIGVLLRKDDAAMVPTLAAATGPNYGRIWNATLTQQLVDRFGDGVNGDWRVPGVWGKALDVVTKDNTTLFAGDRDMFVFLTDERNKVEVPNRRNGLMGTMSRGFFVWNSEVGARKAGIATFFLDYVCGNRIVWNVEGYQEIAIRHTASAPDKLVEQVLPAIDKYAKAPMSGIVTAIEQARAKRIGDKEAVDKFLESRFTKGQAAAIKTAHLTEEQRPIETLWDAVTGTTAYAKTIDWQDERVKVERQAGDILQLAA